MKLDLSRFMEFPGILVVIGIILIFIAIIIGIFAVASDKKEKTEEIEEDENEYDVKIVKLVDDAVEKEQQILAEPVNLIKDNIIPTPVDDETVLEETDALEPAEEDFLETREFVILDNEQKNETGDVETL